MSKVLKVSNEIAQTIADYLAKNSTQSALKAANESEDSGRFKVVISTDEVDRQGDVIDQNGWDFANYKNNPVVLWAHKYDELPVATCDKIYSEGGKTIAEGKFVPGSIYPFAQTVRQMFDAGFLNTTSVGYIPREMQGKTTTKSELLEFSFVPVPANAGALRLMVEKGLNIDELMVKGLIIKEEAEKKDPKTGDKCVNADGEEGELKADNDGNLVCIVPKEQKGIIAEHMNAEANVTEEEMQKKYDNYGAVCDIIMAMGDIYFDPKVTVDGFKDLVNEATDMMKALCEEGADAAEGTEAVMKFYRKALTIRQKTEMSALTAQLKKSTTALDEFLETKTEPQGDESERSKVAEPTADEQIEKNLLSKQVLRALNNATSMALSELNKKNNL